MSLANLLKIGSLLEQPLDPAELQRLIGAARRSLADARLHGLAAESRFDLAYKAVMHCAIAGLRLHGYRLPTSKPGHHQTAIQSLGLTLGLAGPLVAGLDALRRKRNGIDYEADVVSAAMASGCIDAAAQLVDTLAARVATAKP
jgi:hypothetical protein